MSSAENKNQQQKVIFRRIRGRIVPIKVKDSELSIGVATISAGTALAAGSGYATKRFLIASNRSANRVEYYARQIERLRDAYSKSRSSKLKRGGQLSFADLGVRGFERKRVSEIKALARKHAAIGKRFVFGTKITHAVGYGLGSIIAARGFEKIGSEIEKKNKNVGTTFRVSSPILGIATASSAFGLASGLTTKREVLRTVAKLARKFL